MVCDSFLGSVAGLRYKVWVPNSQKAVHFERSSLAISSRQEWCYKGSFVNEVRFLAESGLLLGCFRI